MSDAHRFGFGFGFGPGFADPVSAASSACPFGLPSPVQASHPAPAVYAPLSPEVMSRNAVAGAPYSAAFKLPAGFPVVWLTIAISADQSGATALVPPNTASRPST